MSEDRFGVSVAWGYAVGALLIIIPVFFVVENPMAVLANLRVVDELADIGIVRDVDVGYGFIDGVPEIIAHSTRPVVGNLLLAAFVSIVVGYLIRGGRQRLVARAVGVPPEAGRQVSSYFFGRGLNVLFPFGPGELGTLRLLVEGGSDAAAAMSTVLYTRALEFLGIAAFLIGGLFLSGWGGGLLPFLMSIAVLIGLTVSIRPLGTQAAGGLRVSLWQALNGPTIAATVRGLAARPTLLTGLTAVSTMALVFELAGLYLLKQAFSTREFHLLGDLPVGAFVMAIAVASLTRIVPFTPGGAGLYELSMVAVFVAYGGDSHAATTVAILDGVATNFVMLGLFAITLALRGSRVAILDTWSDFAAFSGARNRGEGFPDRLLDPAA